MLTDGDLTCAIVIALVILLIVLCVWPGLLRVHAADLAGYWADAGGTLYSVKPTGVSRSFTVTSPSGTQVAGRVTGLRGVALGGPSTRHGFVDLGGRRIGWGDGSAWTLQGVH